MKRIIVVASIVLALAAAGAGWWVLRPTSITYLTDAETIRESAGAVPLREVLWQRPTALVDLIDAQVDEFEPRVSVDGGTLFFVRGKPGRNADIYVCTRERAGWGPAQSLAEINTNEDELGPEPSADGQSLYFYSDRAGGIGGYDLWVARKTEDGWRSPTNLGTAVNTAYNEYGPALSPDGGAICFSSNRPKPGEAPPSDDAWRATVREDLYRHDYDLFIARVIDADFQPAAPIDGVNSPNNDGAPAFSPIGDFLYFSSDRSPGFGGFDLYRTRVVRGAFQLPANLGSAVNTAANELDPALDVGGYALHFSSDRAASGVEPAPALPPRYRLYRTFSREVFHDVEVRQPVIEWAAIWRQIGPNLMWALLALAVFVLLLVLMRDAHRRRLSLLARCLIVSLMVHALLMLWFNAVEVTASIATAIRKSGPIRVALSPGTSSGDLSIQIRGGLTHADAPPAVAPRLGRAAPTMTPTASAAPVEMPIEKIAAGPREMSSVRAHAIDTSPDPLVALEGYAAAADYSVAAADLSLPAEHSRTNSPEESDIAPPAAQTMKIGRRRMPIPTSQPSVSTQRVELATEGTGEDGHSFVSLVTKVPPADASPTGGIPTLMQTNLVAAVLGATDAVDASLPMDDSVSRQSGGEATGVPTATIFAPPHADAGIVATSGTQVGAMQQLRPENVGGPTSQPSLVASGGGGARDAMPGFGTALAGVSGAAIGMGTSPSFGSESGGIDVSLPLAEPGMRISALEGGSGPAGSIASGDSSLTPRTGFSPVGGGSATIVNLTPDSPGSGLPGGKSLVAAGSPFGEGRINSDGGGLSDGRIPFAGASGPSTSSSLPVAADPSTVAVQMPDETAPPDKQSDVIQMTPTTSVLGRIRGRVTDYATGERLAGARIQLDLPGGAVIAVSTDAKGTYEFAVPELPDFFAVSASKPNYLPRTRNAANRSVAGRSMRLNFALRPQSLQVVSLEDVPVVHHLGNDAYEGRINSQFQREAEGRSYSGEFELSSDQQNAGQAEIKLLAKGIQCPHKIKVNGRLLETRLDHSPEDGSFGSFSAVFDAMLLQEGTNVLEIRAVSCNGDIDDFEFINLQILLLPSSH